jgi:hypothetical protein
MLIAVFESHLFSPQGLRPPFLCIPPPRTHPLPTAKTRWEPGRSPEPRAAPGRDRAEPSQASPSCSGVHCAGAGDPKAARRPPSGFAGTRVTP